MANNYIKLSQIPLSELENIIIDNNQLKLLTIGNDNILDIVDAYNFLATSNNNLIDDSFAITLKPTVKNINFTTEFNTDISGDKLIYIEHNEKYPRYINIQNNSIVAIDNQNIDTINYNIQATDKLDYLVFSPCRLNNAIPINKNIINNLGIDNQYITSIQLNIPNLKTLSITNCNDLQYFDTKSFNDIYSISITNSYISGALKIKTLSHLIDKVHLYDNALSTIIIEGNDTNLSLTNCQLLPQKKNLLKYVKFKNCIVQDDLINQLKENNTTIEIENGRS